MTYFSSTKIKVGNIYCNVLSIMCVVLIVLFICNLSEFADKAKWISLCFKIRKTVLPYFHSSLSKYSCMRLIPSDNIFAEELQSSISSYICMIYECIFILSGDIDPRLYNAMCIFISFIAVSPIISTMPNGS